MRILFLDLDTLRPDHLSCYGYMRETSPNIDKIAEEGVRFDNYYCSDAPCLPSRTALMSGQFGIHTGVVNHGGKAADIRKEGKERGFRSKLSSESLPGFLRSQGFKTISISPFAERHGAWHFYAGFKEMYNTGKGGSESAEDITPTVLDWIEHNAEEDNWFLHVNYWDPHIPYNYPLKFGNQFKNEPMPDWLTEEIIEKHQSKVGQHSAKEVHGYSNDYDPEYPLWMGEIKDRSDAKKLIDGYDTEIRYMDKHIGKIVDALGKKGVMDDLAIIISADHAENMGELGIYADHITADYITCRIPMIIKWPEGKKGHVDQGLHYNLDLAPTIADLFKTDPVDNWDGQSYAPAIKNGENCGRDHLILSQGAHVCQRSVRFDQWIYMRTYHDGFHLFPEEMLFNIENDPHERFNIASDNEEICKKAVYKLNNWHDKMMKTMKYEKDPLDTVMKEGGPYHARGVLKEYCERLKKTGRRDAIPELKKRHPYEF
ncbi:MAG: sulfatase [bacterium]